MMESYTGTIHGSKPEVWISIIQASVGSLFGDGVFVLLGVFGVVVCGGLLFFFFLCALSLSFSLKYSSILLTHKSLFRYVFLYI